MHNLQIITIYTLKTSVHPSLIHSSFTTDLRNKFLLQLLLLQLLRFN
jgi:hypothetical protein